MTTLNQFFFLGEARLKEISGVLCQFENSHAGADHGHEFRFAATRETLSHRWHLVSFYWNFLSFDAIGPAEFAGEMVLDDGAGTSDIGSVSDYNNWPLDRTSASDITQPDIYGLHRIWLGQWRFTEHSLSKPTGSGADVTLDEFAIYDLGDNLKDAIQTKTFAGTRFKEGRYYKAARYTPFGYGAGIVNKAPSYVSPPVSLPAGMLLRQVGWTWKRPSELPGDYAAVELLETDLALKNYLWDADGDGDGDAEVSSSCFSPGGAVDGPQRWDVGRVPPGPFRVRILFLRRPNPMGVDPGPLTDAYGTLDDNTPLLDSPVFDDLTLVYVPPGGSRVLGWGDGG